MTITPDQNSPFSGTSPPLTRVRRHTQNRVSKHDFDPNEFIAEVKRERFREYRRRFEASGRNEIALDFPLDLSIEPVDYCNYGCPYCPRTHHAGSRTRIPDDWFKRLVDEFAERTEGLSAVGFDRGEPMIDKHLEQKIEYVREKNIVDIILTTNGVFLSPARSRSLIESGLTKLHISIDAATQETYTKTRGGNLAAVEQNVRNFLRIRDEMGTHVPIVRVSFVVCDLNRHEIPLFEEKWAHLVDYIEFQDAIDHSRVDSIPDFEVAAPFWCQYPFQSVSVTAKGEILACCAFYAKHLVHGHLSHGDTIEKAFHDPRTAALRRSFLEKRDYHPACKNCRGTPAADTAVLRQVLLKPQADKARGTS